MQVCYILNELKFIINVLSLIKTPCLMIRLAHFVSSFFTLKYIVSQLSL